MTSSFFCPPFVTSYLAKPPFSLSKKWIEEISFTAQSDEHTVPKVIEIAAKTLVLLGVFFIDLCAHCARAIGKFWEDKISPLTTQDAIPQNVLQIKMRFSSSPCSPFKVEKIPFQSEGEYPTITPSAPLDPDLDFFCEAGLVEDLDDCGDDGDIIDHNPSFPFQSERGCLTTTPSAPPYRDFFCEAVSFALNMCYHNPDTENQIINDIKEGKKVNVVNEWAVIYYLWEREKTNSAGYNFEKPSDIFTSTFLYPEKINTLLDSVWKDFHKLDPIEKKLLTDLVIGQISTPPAQSLQRREYTQNFNNVYNNIREIASHIHVSSKTLS